MTRAGSEAAARAVLDALLVGAGRLMESTGDWAEHLAAVAPSPVADRFVAQLDDEWHDAYPPGPLCHAVTEQVRAHLSAWHEGWPHLWGHVLRVTGLAVALAEDAGIDPVAAYVMGMCHDVAKLDERRTGEPHEVAGAAFAGEILREALPAHVVAAIQAAIRKRGHDDLAHILHDADKLDKIGAVGIVRRVSTGTDGGWIDDALARVEDDARRFPPMYYPRSRALARDKQAFLAWFLPLVQYSQ